MRVDAYTFYKYLFVYLAGKIFPFYFIAKGLQQLETICNYIFIFSRDYIWKLMQLRIDSAQMAEKHLR